MGKRAAAASTKRTAVQARRHRASRVNIPTEELREFVAEEEKQPGACERAGVRECESERLMA